MSGAGTATFVIHRNIQRWRKLLESEGEEVRRKTILELLVKEEAKLAELPPAPTESD